MTLVAFLAALGSAVLHAVWNTLARSRPEPGNGFGAIVVMAGVVALPIAAWRGVPTEPIVWAWLAVGIMFNATAIRLTMAAYRRLPLSLAYPLSRGSAPLMVALVEFGLIAHALPSPGIIVGMAVVSGAVLLLAKSARSGDGLDRKGLLFTLGAAVCTAGFTLTDAQGVRVHGDPLSYGAMVAILNAIALPLIQRAEGKSLAGMMKGNIVFGFFASIVSMASYLLVLFAFMHGPVAPSSAIRETSVLFATLFAALFLGEKPGALRWIAIAIAAGGVALIRTG